jgi:hypothetical protein
MRSIPLLATFVLLATLVPFTVMAAFPAAAQPPEPPPPPPPPKEPTPAEALGDTPSVDESV